MAPSVWVRLAIVAFLLAAGLAVFVPIVFVFQCVGEVGDEFGDLVAITEDTVVSPDGEWALVVSVRDEGACGGSTSVLVRVASDEHGGQDTKFYEGEWNPDLATRWLDARTVEVDGHWYMPFVEHSLKTSSSRTSGSATDSLGYVHNPIQAGEQIVMLSGVWLTLPMNLAGELLTRRAPEAARPYQELLAGLSVWALGSWRYVFLAVNGPDEIPCWATVAGGTVLEKSDDGSIEIRWVKDERWLVVITRLPGRLMGVLIERNASFDIATEARKGAERLWEDMAVGGVSLPAPANTGF